MRNRASPRRRTPQFCSKRTTSTTGLHRSKGDENDTGLLSESMLQAKSSIDHSWTRVPPYSRHHNIALVYSPLPNRIMPPALGLSFVRCNLVSGLGIAGIEARDFGFEIPSAAGSQEVPNFSTQSMDNRRTITGTATKSEHRRRQK